MPDFNDVDFFSDPGLVADSYPYYEYLREQCPVTHVPRSGVVAVTGYDELTQVYRDSATFSAVNSSLGPFPLPFEVTGDDISEQIEAHRDQFPICEHLVSFDPPRHTAHRALLNGLFTPKRLKENEEFMWHLADQLIDEFVADGRCEFASAYGQPFPLLVITDLLGVPEADHPMFRQLLAGKGPAEDPAWAQRDADGSVNMNPLAYLDKWFTTYISDRRATPAQDILTEIATQRFPDGSLPEVVDLVRIATFLFIAGHETTAGLLSSALRVLAEDPELQDTLRNNRDRIPNFVEEMLRLESPIKSDFRLTRVATTLGGVELPAGHDGDAAARRRQPGSTPLRLPCRTTSGPPERPPETLPLPAERTVALEGHSPGSRAGCPSSGSWIGSWTFGSMKHNTDRPGIVAFPTCRSTSFGGWKRCTSSSPRSHDERSVAGVGRQAGTDRITRSVVCGRRSR